MYIKITHSKEMSSKRDRKSSTKSLKGITDPGLRRASQIAGVPRMSGEVADMSRVMIKDYLRTILSDAVVLQEHANRQTLQFEDVRLALQLNGENYYGF